MTARELSMPLVKLPRTVPARPVTITLTLALLMSTTGCINFFPVPRTGEKREAILLAKVLMTLAPQAKALLTDERNCANELKIDLDEAGDKVGGVKGSERFTSYIDRLVVIRNKREQIRDTVRQGVYDSPMVFVIQHDAVVTMNDEIARTQTWIQFAQNLRLRAELGRIKDFPELPILIGQLNGFLDAPAEDPLYSQVRDLQGEFRFGEGEVAP
jgi:hypothetical protein